MYNKRSSVGRKLSAGKGKREIAKADVSSRNFTQEATAYQNIIKELSSIKVRVDKVSK
jgi:hypothetical protein